MANPEHVDIVSQGADTIEEWRENNPGIIFDLEKANLSGIDLSNADLSYANFEFANLSRTNLEGADLSHANLLFTKMIRTNLNNVDLYSAEVGSSDLLKADLTNAYLALTIFHSSDLRGAIFHEADLDNTVFCEVKLAKAVLSQANSVGVIWSRLDLSQTIGLESVIHKGPSTIGLDTLVRSKGKITDIFLRGCGLSDDFISFVPSHFSGSALDFYSCFISYSHEDKLFARRLHDALQGRGIRCWLDEHQILPGDNIYDRIDHGIRVWDKVLLCASKHSLTSGWVDDELKHAFAKEKQLFKDRGCEVLSLIPLNLDGYLFSDWNHPKKNQVLERNAPDFTGWESDNAKFEKQFERVVKSLQTNNTGREPEPPSKL